MESLLKTIGRRDRIDLPELGYSSIKAKIDTGAYGSAIHCSRIEIKQEDGKDILSFELFDPSYSKYKKKKCVFEQFDDKLVKSSSGDTEHRYSIITDAIIFGIKVRTEFSLTDRSQMKYPILLGRKFLYNRFLVDVRLKDVSYRMKAKK